ncbi:hypothetical protein ACHAXM_004512 [Skeletonema potamos]|jgi:peptide-methionine (S)-S-oxide reductase
MTATSSSNIIFFVILLLLCCSSCRVQHHSNIAHAWSSSSSATNIGRSYYWGSTTLLLAHSGKGSGGGLASATAANDKECTTATTDTYDDVASILQSLTTTTTTTHKPLPKSGDILTFTLLRFQPPTDSKNSIVLEPLFDTSGTLQLRLHHGNYLPGLHQLLSTMMPGETIVGSTIDAGYGSYNPQLVFQIDASQLQVDTSLVKIGTVLAMGNGMEVRVTKIEDESSAGSRTGNGHDEKLIWTLDGNHPLAGATYEVDVRLDAVEMAPLDWEYSSSADDDEEEDDDKEKEDNGGGESKYKVATFGLGCFWGGELAYQRLPGVVSTSVGYTQGEKVNPSYEEVCTGTTGHTEAIQVIYDPNVVTYRSLVHLAFNRLGDDIYKHNQVGNDRGTQYRHGIYYHNEEQRQVAEELLSSYATADKEVFTEVKQAKIFYMAEDYHQQYLLKGGQSAKKGASESIRCYG